MSLAYAALAAQHRGAPVSRSDDFQTHACRTLASSAHVKALFPGPPFCCSTAMPSSRPSVSDIPQVMKQESLVPFPGLCLPILSSARRLLHALQPCPRPCVAAILPGRCSVSESPPPTKHNSLVFFPGFLFHLFVFLLSLSRHLMRGRSFFVKLCVSLLTPASGTRSPLPRPSPLPPQSFGSDCSSSTQSRKSLAACSCTCFGSPA